MLSAAYEQGPSVHMNSLDIARVALIFLLLGVAATFLMYRLWGYEFDKETKTSSAPKWAMLMHRVLGYLFLLFYIAIMWHMVPRLWEYQVEFPARTTAHILLGFTVGFLLFIKVAILRFFRHFEEWMPYLGTAILWATVMMLAFSIPFVFKEEAAADRAFAVENLQRVERLLPMAEMPEKALKGLAKEKSLRKGRKVLLRGCVKCHDLKTILAKPRTPKNWYRTVKRMGEKPTLFTPLSEAQQYQVTAYLVAITPSLQQSAKRIRAAEEDKAEAMQALAEPDELEGTEVPPEVTPEVPPVPDGTDTAPAQTDEPKVTPVATTKKPVKKPRPTPNPAKAKSLFEDECSQCHDISDIDDDPPGSRRSINRLMERMTENGLELGRRKARIIKWYLNEHYVKKSL